MDFVIDANILFAALIKKKFNYNLLFRNELHFYAPEYIFKEFDKHKAEIFSKTENTREEFDRLTEVLKRRIVLVPLEELVQYVEEAEKITPDPDDMVYFALALKLNIPLWTNDKKLKKQDRVKIYSTEDTVKLINSK